MDTFLDDHWTDTLLKKKSNPWFLHLHSYLYHQEIMIYCATDVSSVDVDLLIPEVSLFERTESRGGGRRLNDAFGCICIIINGKLQIVHCILNERTHVKISKHKKK